MADRNVVIQGLIEVAMTGKGGQEAVDSFKKIAAGAKETEKAVAGLGTSATQSVGRLDAAVGSLGRTVAGYFAAGALVNFLRDSYIGFARTERQALAVENQIKSLGQAAEGSNFRDFIAQLSISSGILDDDLIPALQRALGAFKNLATAEEIVTLASKFASAGIGDVASNVDAISRFFQTGRTQGIAQFGVNVKGAADGVLDLNTGLRELRSAAAAVGGGFNDAQFKLDSFRVLTDTVSDSVGRLQDKLSDLYLKYSQSPLAQGARARLAVGAGSGTPFGPQLPTAAELQFAKEQTTRDANAAKEAADKKVKAATDAAAKILDVNAKNSEEILKIEIDAAEKGTQRRLQLELELNEKLRADALRNLPTGASAELVNQVFDRAAGAIARDQQKFIDEAGKKALDEYRKWLDDKRKAEKEAADDSIRIAQDTADKIQSIEEQKQRWQFETIQRNKQSLEDSINSISGSLQSIFAKHKGFAIGLAIMDTANAIMQVWAASDGSPWYVKLAKSLAVAAIGAEQIANIRSASVTGGGGASSGGGGTAASPSFAASSPTAPPPAFTSGGSGVAPLSAAQLGSFGGGPVAGGGNVIYQIRNSFGDERSMRKLAREIDRVKSNDPSRLR